MSSFIEIPRPLLESIATGDEGIPRLYFCGDPVSRRLFWLRLRWIHRLAQEFASPHRSCLDFGAGGGVLLPSLSRIFSQVVSIDLNTQEAARVVEHFGLENTKLVRGDVTQTELKDAPFDAIVAADVLEHFRDLAPPIAALRRWLRDDGTLFTSLPTENALYVALRLLLGIEKPSDHYHTAYEVERVLERSGFRRLRRWFVPFRVRIAPLYVISAWRKDPAWNAASEA